MPLALIGYAAISLAFQPDPAVLRKVFEDALARRERDYGPADPTTSQACRNLGFFLRENGDLKAAVEPLQRAIKIDEISYGPQARQTLSDVTALASVSPPAEAEILLKRALTSTDAGIVGPALASLGDLRSVAGDKTGAAFFWRQALARAEAVDGKDGAVVGTILNALSSVVDVKEGIQLLERTLDSTRREWGERHPETATAEMNLAGLLLKGGRTADAVTMASRGLENFEATLGPEHSRTAAAARTLADSLLAKGDGAGAENLYRRALAIDHKALGPRDAQTLGDAHSLIIYLRRKGRLQDAATLAREFPGASGFDPAVTAGH